MGKHDKVLAAIFAEPTKANIKWHDIESLCKHLGAAIEEGRGSRVRMTLNEVRATFHRPHPQPNANKGAVEAVRVFLTEAGF
jgi:hypothetical protein